MRRNCNCSLTFSWFFRHHASCSAPAAACTAAMMISFHCCGQTPLPLPPAAQLPQQQQQQQRWHVEGGYTASVIFTYLWMCNKHKRTVCGWVIGSVRLAAVDEGLLGQQPGREVVDALLVVGWTVCVPHQGPLSQEAGGGLGGGLCCWFACGAAGASSLLGCQ